MLRIARFGILVVLRGDIPEGIVQSIAQSVDHIDVPMVLSISKPFDKIIDGGLSIPPQKSL